MTLDQLRIFVMVAKLEHVTRASYALDMVQSAVSKAIANLESEVDFRLFDRVGRNIRLTVVGAVFRDQAVDLLAHADRFSAWTLELRRARHDASSLDPLRKMLGRFELEPILFGERSDRIGETGIWRMPEMTGRGK